jgi:hypothetical protein
MQKKFAQHHDEGEDEMESRIMLDWIMMHFQFD